MGYSQALEEQMKLMREEISMAHQGGREELRIISHARASVLEIAEPFYWNPNICQLMQEVPTDALEETILQPAMFPCSYGFWWFGRPIELPRWDGDCTDMQAILWNAPFGSHGTGIEIYTYHYFWGRRPIEAFSPEGGFMMPGIASFGTFDWRYGESLGDAFRATLGGDYRNEREREENRQIAADPWSREALLRFAAMLLFIQQRILIAPQQRAERHTRKRLADEGYQHEPLVRVVELRRKQARSEHHGDSEPVEWSHQWIVSGHWRQQWYPSLNAYQPRWIMPYVKGPEDKPLKPPRAKVFAVIR